MGLDAVQPGVDTQKVLDLAKEAHRTCPSSGTAGDLISALLFRATAELARTEPHFAKFRDMYNRSIGFANTLAAAIESPAMATKILANEDFRAAVALLQEQQKLFPDGPSPFTWALLRKADPAAADKLADVIRHHTRTLLENSIANDLHPTSAEQAMENSWILDIQGKHDQARAARQKVIDMGIPLPPLTAE